jgi:hypothetical protein
MSTQIRKYSNPDRLADVMALIQVLALDPYAHRSEKGLLDELQGPPRSAERWTTVATEHPEFFRVREGEKHGMSLLARHVLPVGEGGGRELPIEFTGKLLEAAINLYDREVTRRERMKYLIPLIVAILAAAGSIVAAVLSH